MIEVGLLRGMHSWGRSGHIRQGLALSRSMYHTVAGVGEIVEGRAGAIAVEGAQAGQTSGSWMVGDEIPVSVG
jgi:hypothetical protein